MGPDRKRFLHDLPTRETLLGSETRVHSHDLMSGAFSLGRENSEEETPTGIENTFRQVVIFHHIGDLKVFHHNTLIALGIGLRCLEMVISPLTGDLQMGFRHMLRGFPASVASLLTTAQLTLLASECPLRCAIEARVLNRVSFGVREEGFQPHIKTDSRMGTGRGKVFGLWRSFTDNESIPVSITHEMRNEINQSKQTL